MQQMDNEVQIITSDAISALNRTEIDIQIMTAKKWPRDLGKVLNQIETLATMDTETAEDCFYALRRGKGEDQKTIEGVSVRFAEIIASAWGNIRISTRIIANDGRTITAQGMCHDLETNVATLVEVSRSITDKIGRTYSNDMVVLTGNAASAIAYRNAVLKVIPKAITKKIIERTKDVAIGKAMDVETSRANCLANYKKAGVTDKMICDYLEIKNIQEIGKEELFELKGLWNAIKEGTTSIKETFIQKGREPEVTPIPKAGYKNLVEIDEDVLRGALTPEQADQERKKFRENAGK